MLSVVAVAERLIWLHTGHRVLGSINLDSLPELRGLCPAASACRLCRHLPEGSAAGRWAEVKESGTGGLFAYRCEDGSFFWPFPTRGQSPELRRLWLDRTGAPFEA